MMIEATRRAVLAAIAASLAMPAFADHPGENLDKVLLKQEKYFQTIDNPAAPKFRLADAEGNLVRLSDFADKVVVLNFVYASCPDICPLHAEKIASIQQKVNSSAMKTMVQFISITTDPLNDTAEVLSDYGKTHGLDNSNWMILTKTADQPFDATRQLAKLYGVEFTMSADSDMQMHGAVTHVIDRGGRFAAKFHGLRFSDVNAVLYVNGLTNRLRSPEADRGWLDRISDLFK